MFTRKISPKQTDKRHSGSDGLRVLAMLAVILFHLRPDLVPGGFLGVVIFLVLAGYYTCRSFLCQPKLDLPRYYYKRFSALWPPLLFMLALVGLYAAFFLPEVYRDFCTGAPSAALGYHNIAEIVKDHSYFARQGSFDPTTHLWALALEAQYYLVFPILFLLLKKLAGRLPGKLRPYGRECAGILLLLLSVCSALYMGLSFRPGVDPTRCYYDPFMRAHAFLNGAAFALIIAGRQYRRAFRQATGRDNAQANSAPKSLPLIWRTILAWLVLVGLVAAYFITNYASPFIYRGGFYLYSLLALAFILLGGFKTVPGMGFMDSAIFRYLASRSYHIYLWQYALMIIVNTAFRFSKMGFWSKCALQMICLVPLAEISYRIFSQKGKVRQSFRNSLALVLSFILVAVLLLPPAEAPEAKAPELDGDQVMAAIEANQSKQAALMAKESEAASRETQNEAALEAEREKLAQATDKLLDHAAEFVSDDNPYGFSPNACQLMKDLNVVVVGDSVMAMAMDNLRLYIPRIYIDAAVSRHFSAGPDLIQALDAGGVRGDILIVALSTNGDLFKEDIERYVQVAGDRLLIFVNTIVPQTWEEPNNQKLAKAAANDDHVYVADWYSQGKSHPEYFYEDAYHPVPDGAFVYDRVILETMLEALATGEFTLHAPLTFPPSPPVVSPSAPVGDSPEEVPDPVTDLPTSPSEQVSSPGVEPDPGSPRPTANQVTSPPPPAPTSPPAPTPGSSPEASTGPTSPPPMN